MHFVKGVLKFLLDLMVIALSAFLASLAFPSKYVENGLPFLAFFYLIPMFYIIWRRGWGTVWLFGAVYGFLFYLFYNYWLETFHPLAILIAPILESVQYALLFMCLRFSKTLFRRHYSIAAAFLYTAYLYLTQQGFLAYPYGNIASAVYSYTPLIQMAEVTGIWGIGMVLVLPQVIFSEILFERDWKGCRKSFLFSLALLLLSYVGGMVSLEIWEKKESSRTIKVAAIQHSADTWKGGYSTYKENFENLKALTLEAMEAEPDIVVWSETAFVPSVAWHSAYPNNVATSKLCNDFVSFCSNIGVPLITGNPEGVIKDKELAPILESGEWNWKTYNTVILFADGGIQGTYRKQHLVPFTEYFPYEKELPWLYELLLANDYKWWEVGEEATVFEYDGLKFSTPICFEDTFGALNAEFVAKGAEVLLNLSNDFWSQALQAELQHYQLAVFRAVENRKPLLRSTNSGITCMVDVTGKTYGILPPFEKAWGIYEMELYEDQALTFYTRHPDLFGKLHVALAALSVALGISLKISSPIIRRRKERKDREERLSHLFEGMDESTEC
ncbi:MAG: apolipoprotein N-acyltransferase [Candidatus Ornithospirochaeta sp.]|nr:apolipoprotein N-acyltransferase [Sphaerochaetaceae bacterium]MDY5523654.1 apolipoprotein N-acyltransferase [Candidatus Ornithospirochaeta sp.]